MTAAPPARRLPLDRAGIVSTASDAIAKEGIEQFSLRQLAGRLGVTPPALYAHVRSKEELVRAVAEQEFARFDARLGAIGETDPIARIRAGCRVYLDHARENPQLFRLMLQFRPVLNGAPDGEVLEAAALSWNTGAAAVQEAIDAGLLRSTDAFSASLVIWVAVHGLVSLVLSGARFGVDEEERLFESLLDVVLAGLAPRRASTG